jgi:hypothetical protein
MRFRFTVRTMLLATVVALLLAPIPAAADDGVEPRNLLLVNPGDLFNGLLTLQYERGLARHVGLEFGLSVLAFRGVFGSPVEADVIAIAPEIALRFHFIRPAPRGLWFGPSINGAYLVQNTQAPRRAFGYGFGAAVGYTFTFGPFALQLGLGGAVHDSGDGFRWSPRLRLGVGAAF